MKEKYRMYQLDPAPPKLGLQECIEAYIATGDAAFFAQFLHWYEPTINKKAQNFEQQYVMPDHFEDLKEAYVMGLLEALDGYEKEKGPFVPYAERRGERAMHDYIRTMRTGCTVPSDTEYYLLRKAMRLFEEHDERTDEEAIAMIGKAIRREPKTVLEMIRSGTQNMCVLELDRETGDEDDEPLEIGSLSAEPSTLFFQAYELDALLDAFRKLDYREREMLSRRYGFCPECFSVVDKDGRPLPKETYEDIMLDFGLSSPDTVEKTCKRALGKIRSSLKDFSFSCLQFVSN